MARHQVWFGVLVAAGALGLAACSSGPSSSTGTTTSSSPTSSSTTGSSSTVPATGLHPDSSFCTEWNQLKETLTTLVTTLPHNLSDLAADQQAANTALTTASQSAAKVVAAASSAPANVRSALTTLDNVLPMEKAAIADATSVAQIESNLPTLESNPKLATALTTLADYSSAQCGSSATTVTPATS